MANGSTATTGSTQVYRIGANNNFKPVEVDCFEGYIHYAFSSQESLLTKTIREAETEQVISAYAKNGGLITLTVSDGTKFREKESLQVRTTADVHKGNIAIESINGNVLTCVNQLDVTGNDENPNGYIAGDKIIMRADPILRDIDLLEVPSRAYPYFIFKSDSSSCIINFNTNLKKK